LEGKTSLNNLTTLEVYSEGDTRLANKQASKQGRFLLACLPRSALKTCLLACWPPEPDLSLQFLVTAPCLQLLDDMISSGAYWQAISTYAYNYRVGGAELNSSNYFSRDM
jgi:hypothetical protein